MIKPRLAHTTARITLLQEQKGKRTLPGKRASALPSFVATLLPWRALGLYVVVTMGPVLRED